jgi:hypothetical protein
MNKVLLIFVLVYYVLGQLMLSGGDFSILPNLPKMYAHCKATEHHDMPPFDLITDHLININGLFDAHDNGDEQKPHQPFPLHMQLESMTSFQPLTEHRLLCLKSTQTSPLFQDVQ